MLIGAYGMFWQRDEVLWKPGRGQPFRLLGTRGGTTPTRKVVDFRRARGVYVLFDDHGAYYVGLAKGKEGLGGRLKAHLRDEHKDSWSRFCWFAFDEVTQRRDSQGLTLLRHRDRPMPSGSDDLIKEVEALLIALMNTRNINTMRFKRANQWTQVSHHDVQWYLDRLS